MYGYGNYGETYKRTLELGDILGLQAESTSGKSYILLEISDYFPKSDVLIYGGVSPTSFFHEKGINDKEKDATIVNLERKILIFLDLPHYLLMEKLRPILSHDSPITIKRRI